MTKIELAGKIGRVASKYDVPPELAILLAMQESKLSHTRADGSVLASKAGALGVMQIMPGTAAEMNVDPFDLEGNIEGGMRYLARLYAEFKDWQIATAAYNAGPGRMKKVLAGKNQLPTETHNYVWKIWGEPLKFGGD